MTFGNLFREIVNSPRDLCFSESEVNGSVIDPLALNSENIFGTYAKLLFVWQPQTNKNTKT